MAGPSSTRIPCEPARTALSKSGFYDLEDFQNIPQSSLTNEIHPIFRRRNFCDTQFVFHYPALEPSLRLASHYIERSLPIFYSILCCTPQREASSDNPGGFVYALPDPVPLTAEQEQETRDMLLQMAKVIDFTLVELGDIGFAATRVRSRCNDGTVPGSSSDVYINTTLYDPLERNYFAPEDDIVEKTWYEFKLSTSLLHELGHAAENASAWSRQHKTATVFLNSSNELGFEVEAYLFGGLLAKNVRGRHFYFSHGKKSGLTGLFCLYDWPNPRLVKAYEGSDQRDIKGNVIMVRTGARSLGKVYCLWSLSLLFMADLLQDDFWERQGELKVKRETGYRFDTDDGGKNTLISVGADDQVSCVPRGYRVSEHGLVRKRKTGERDAGGPGSSHKKQKVSSRREEGPEYGYYNIDAMVIEGGTLA